MTETVDFPQARIDELLAVVELTTRHHDDGKRACAMDLLGMAIQGEWTDTPECVHPVLAQAVHKINDHRDTTTDDRRSLVVDAGPLLLGTVAKPAVWACLVRHKAGLTAAGLAAALAGTPETHLSSANLSSANLRSADLRSADLRSADLRYANLRSADLRYADLISANLRSANLSSADLRYANLRSANLSSADLRYANLRSANLRSADLRYANLRSAKYSPLTLWPDEYDPAAHGAVSL